MNRRRAPGLRLSRRAGLVCALLAAACGGPAEVQNPLSATPTEADPEERVPAPLVEVWRHVSRAPTAGLPREPRLRPAVGDDHVYVAYDDLLEALGAASGAVRWELSLPAPLTAAPVVTTDHLVLPLGAVEPGEGQAGLSPSLWWIGTIGGNLMERASLEAPVVALAPLGADVVAADAVTVRRLAPGGAAAWAADLPGVLTLTPSPDGDAVYATTDAGALEALAAADGGDRWRHALEEDADGDGRVTAPAFDDEGNLYLGGTDRQVVALRPGNGSRRWRRRIGNDVVAAPAVTGRYVWVAGLDGLLHGYDAGNGTELLSQSLSGRTFADLARHGPWAVVGSYFGPWLRLRAPVRRADERAPVRNNVATGTRLEISPGTGPAGVALVNGDGSLVFLRIVPPGS